MKKEASFKKKKKKESFNKKNRRYKEKSVKNFKSEITIIEIKVQ